MILLKLTCCVKVSEKLFTNVMHQIVLIYNDLSGFIKKNAKEYHNMNQHMTKQTTKWCVYSVKTYISLDISSFFASGDLLYADNFCKYICSLNLDQD